MGCWGTKEVNMVGHNDIAADNPLLRSFPCVYEGFMDGLIRDNLPPLMCAHGKKDDGCFVESLNRRMVRGMFTFGVF